MLDRDELPGYRSVILSRTSNISKKSDSSLNRQVKKLTNEGEILKEEFGGEIKKIYKNKQSASSMDRDTLDEILEMAKNNEFDILMVWAIHRLTRANPLETMKYLIKLADEGIILYSNRESYYDWDDPDDVTRLMDRISSARSWRNEIQRGAVAGNKDTLQSGHWPYGPIGYGLADDEERGIIIIKEEYKDIIQSVYETYLDCEDEEETAVSISNKIHSDDIDIEPPSDNQIENILENELYTGELVEKKTGEFVREKSDIKIIEQKIFDKVQDLRSEQVENKTNLDSKDLPSEIYNLICRYGQEYAVEQVSAIRWCCPECESTDINVSDTIIESLGIHLPRIYCNNDSCSTEGESSYQGPAIRVRELDKIDLSHPFICPECQRTEEFTVEPAAEIESEQQMYKYTCNYCGESMIKSSDPDPNVRGLHSANSINLRSDDINKDDAKSTDNNQLNPNQTDLDAETVLQEYLEKEGPNKEVAQEVMITAANILAEEGSMSTADLKNELHERYGKEYSSKDSMWESTFMRLYSDIPMVSKVSYGEYDFRDEQFELIIDSILDLLSKRS